MAEIFGWIGGRVAVGLGVGNMVKYDRPWHLLLSYGRYGAARLATKDATINLYHVRWGFVVLKQKRFIINIKMTIIARCTSRR